MEKIDNIKLDGKFYSHFLQTKGYTAEMKQCIEETTSELITKETDANRPGVLLGKIQSGKTRTFIERLKVFVGY